MYHFDCAPGTIWDPSIDTCNHPESVYPPRNCKMSPSGSSTTTDQAPSSASTGSTATITESTTAEPPGSSTTASESSTKSTSEGTTAPASIASTQPTSDSSTETTSGTTTEKPKNPTVCDRPGFYPDPTWCDKFYRCVDNGRGFNVYHFDCAPGTIWDPSIDTCNHPESVYPPRNCKMSPSGSSTTTDQAPSSAGTGSTATITDSTTAPTEPTESNTAASESSTEPTSDGTTVTTTEASTQSTITDSTTSSIAPTETNTAASESSTVSTSEGTTVTATVASTVSTITDSTTAPTAPTESNTATSESSTEPTSEGTTVTATEASTQSTITDSTISSTAPTGNSTAAFVSSTVSTSEGTTATVASTEPTSESHTESTSGATTKKPNNPTVCDRPGFYPDPTWCDKFYRCVDNGRGFNVYHFDCAPGTIWDPSIDTCNHPESVYPPRNCKMSPSGSSTTTEQTSSNASTGSTATTTQSTTAEPPGSSTTASESSTNSTSEGTTAPATIASTQPTSDSSTETTSGTTTEKPKNLTVCDRPGFYPDPTWCDKFYRCVDNGRGFNVYHFDCAPGTIWDPSIDTCNYPESVYPPRNCMMPLLDSTTNAVQTSSSASTESTATITESNTAPAAPTESSTAVSESSTESTSESTTGTTTEAATQSTITDSTTSSIAPTGTSTAASESSTESTSEGSSVTATVPSTQPTITDSTTSPTAPTGTSTAASESSTESTSKGTTETTTKASTEPTSESGTEITSEETTKEPNNATVCDKPGFYPDPTLCDKFYQCIDNGNGFDVKYFICATGTIFDPNIGRCNQPESVHPPRDCAMFTTTVSTTTESTTRTAETATSTTGFTTGSTTEASIPTPCPIGNLTDEQIVLICPSGFRRHPKYCNLFYQCTMENNVDIKVLVLSCPEGLIFDDQKLQCLPEDKTDQHCKGTKASARFYRKLEESSMSPIKASSEVLCPGAGHYPYKQGCSSAFYNCKQNSRGNLEGYLYKCPENFLYSSVSRRCERATRLPLCTIFKDKDKENWEERWQIPIEESNLSARSLFV